MRSAFVLLLCSASLACSSSSTNEAPASGGSAGASGGSAGASGGGGASGGSGGSAGASGGSGGASGGSGGASGGSGGASGGSGGASGGSGGSSGGPSCTAISDGFDCAPGKPGSVAVDATALYWTVRDGAGAEHLFRVPKTTTPTSVSPWVVIGKVLAVGDIVADGDQIFVATTTNSRQLIKYAAPAGTETVLVDDSACLQPYARGPLASDSAAIYFACNATQDFIGQHKKSDSSTSPLFTYPGGVSANIGGLASNGSTLAIAMDDLDTIPLPNGTAGLVAAGAGYTRVGVVGNVIYAQSADAVKTHNIGAGAGNDALTGVAGIVDFRVDASGIYAISTTEVVGRKLSSLGKKVIQAGVSPGGIALDATRVYWTETTGKVRHAERALVTP